MKRNFPEHHSHLIALMKELGTKIPSTMEGFSGLHKSSIAKGALVTKTKELIALGIAITVRCDGCIAFHVHDCLESGATNEEIVRAIGVAIMMGGGPSVMYGCDALEALKQFKALRDNG